MPQPKPLNHLLARLDPRMVNDAKREAFLSIERNKPFMPYGAPVSYPTGLSSKERLKLMALDEFTFDLCIVNAREVALKAINKMMKG